MGVIAPKRGEVWWINFEPHQGSEVNKLRPAVVVSNNIANKYLDRFQVVPLTSNIDRVYPGECIVSLKKQDGKAMSNQIMTVSKIRFGKRIQKLSADDVQLLDSALRVQLSLP